MTTKETVIYCGDCGINAEPIKDHAGHYLKYGTRYESVGDEVLAAHDAVTCPTASKQADTIGQVLS